MRAKVPFVDKSGMVVGRAEMEYPPVSETEYFKVEVHGCDFVYEHELPAGPYYKMKLFRRTKRSIPSGGEEWVYVEVTKDDLFPCRVCRSFASNVGPRFPTPAEPSHPDCPECNRVEFLNQGGEVVEVTVPLRVELPPPAERVDVDLSGFEVTRKLPKVRRVGQEVVMEGDKVKEVWDLVEPVDEEENS